MTGLKYRTKIGSTVDNKIYKEFKELSDNTKIPLSKLLDEALMDVVEKYKKHKQYLLKSNTTEIQQSEP